MSKNLQTELLRNNIAQRLNFDMEVIVHESIDSTNDWSLAQCKRGRRLPFACFAENQMAGKGRRGKQWLMSAHTNIAMSVSWSVVSSCQQLQLLPLSVALAVVKTLEGVGLEQVQVKWPNDIYVREKKIAGILIETQPLKDMLTSDECDGESEESQLAVVIGVGLNYDMSSPDGLMDKNVEQIMHDITDILSETRSQKIDKKIDREMIASALLQNVIDVCQSFQKNSAHYLREFRQCYDYCKNKSVDILLDNQETLSGVAQGVNDAAELIVNINGKEHVFNSAEVSVKTGAQ